MWNKILFILFAPPAIVLIGTIGYRSIEGWPWISSLYMAIITITTVGFGEVLPLSNAGRLFTISLIIISFGTLTYCIATTIAFIVEGGIVDFVRRTRMEKNIDQLSNHYIVAGFGHKGRAVCRNLDDHAVSYIVIEYDPAKIDLLTESKSLFLKGNILEDDILYRARIEHAAGLIAILDNDAENTYLVLTAKQLNAKLKVIAWATSEEDERKLQRAGADRVLSPFLLGGTQTVQSVLRPNVIDFLHFALSFEHEDMQLEQVTIPEQSRYSTKSLVELELTDEFRINVLGVKRGDDLIFNPPSSTVIHGNDILIALGSKQNLDAFTAQL